MTIRARIVAACLILGLSFGSGFAQSSTDKKARALYFAAEQAYLDGKYREASDTLSVIRTLLGETNPLLEALRIKILYGFGEKFEDKGGNSSRRFFERAKRYLDDFFEMDMEVSRELSVEMARYAVKIEKKLAAYRLREADQKQQAAEKQAKPATSLRQTAPSATGGNKSDQAGGWVAYENDRFGFTLSYPGDVFIQGPTPANNDGHQFRSRDGRAVLTVFAHFNTRHWPTIGAYKAGLIKSGRYRSVTYDRSKTDWLVLSGFRGKKIYYEKHIFSCNAKLINVLQFEYDTASKETYSPMISHFVKSFAPGFGYDVERSECG